VGRNLTFFLEFKVCKVSGVLLLSLFVPLERLTLSFLPSDTLGWFRPATTSAVAELDLRCVAFVAGGLIDFCDEKEGGEECDVYLGLVEAFFFRHLLLLLNLNYFAYVAGGLCTWDEEGG
jgi:hypothetical protein